MLRRRILYLICLIGCVVFYIAYREWMSWMFLMALLFLPWFSFLISLPAMLCVHLSVSSDLKMHRDDICPIYLRMRCALPVPPIAWKFRIISNFDRSETVMKGANDFHAKHCGCYTISIKGGWKYDYLGLLRIPFGKKMTQKIYVLPKPVPVDDLPSLKTYLTGRWKPKAGGFAENYELREYRAGDSLRHIHWKLSSKTGKFIYREPMIQVRGKLALSMSLSGNAEQIDLKLGKLLFVSQQFLTQGLPHEVHCKTKQSVEVFRIASQLDLDHMLFALINSEPSNDDLAPSVIASWKYHIGGDTDEA